MAKIIYKPYKKSEWGKIERPTPLTTEKGRVIETVRIGVAIHKDTGQEEDIFEDIYADLIPSIIPVRSRLKASINISNTPKLVVFEGYDIIPHNPQMSGYIETIKRALPAIEEDIYYRAYRYGWESTVNHKAMDYAIRAIVQEVNTSTGGNFPAVLIIAIMRMCEAQGLFQEDDLDENSVLIRDRIAAMDERELKVASGDVVASVMYDGLFKSQPLTEALNGISYENDYVIKMIMQEVFKRYVLN